MYTHTHRYRYTQLPHQSLVTTTLYICSEISFNSNIHLQSYTTKGILLYVPGSNSVRKLLRIGRYLIEITGNYGYLRRLKLFVLISSSSTHTHSHTHDTNFVLNRSYFIGALAI